MPSAAAELSSVSTALDELARRVSAIADGYAGDKREDVAGELYAVERALSSARRTLARLLDGHRA